MTFAATVCVCFFSLSLSLVRIQNRWSETRAREHKLEIPPPYPGYAHAAIVGRRGAKARQMRPRGSVCVRASEECVLSLSTPRVRLTLSLSHSLSLEGWGRGRGRMNRYCTADPTTTVPTRPLSVVTPGPGDPEVAYAGRGTASAPSEPVCRSADDSASRVVFAGWTRPRGAVIRGGGEKK